MLAHGAKALSRLDARSEPPPPARARRRALALCLVPVAAAAGVMFALGRPAPAMQEFRHARHIEVAMRHDGSAVAELALATHHHEHDAAHLHIDVPTGVAMHLDNDARSSACRTVRCIHRLHSRAQPHHSPLRVVLSKPGRYVIHVTHESGGARVRERFVVLAHERETPAG